MPYVRIDDGFPEHPKTIGLTDPAKALWLDALCYAHRARTDGHIPAGWMPPNRRRHATILVNRRLWVVDPAGDGWLIHGYLDWNPSKAQLEQDWQARSERGRKAARARWDRDADAMPDGNA